MVSEQTVSAASLLAIDDDETILALVDMLMRPKVAQLWTCSDPREGLRLAMTYKPSLILLDNHMPGMLGIEVLAQLRKMPATEHIPVIMMSSDSSRGTVESAMSSSVAGYLLKPCDPDELVEKLSPWLGLPWHRHQHSPAGSPALSQAQARQLEALSLLSVLDAIGAELDGVALACRDAEALRPGLERLAAFRQALLQGDFELLGRSDGFAQLLRRNLAAQQQLHPGLGGRSPERCHDNLAVLFEHLQQRASLLAPPAQAPVWLGLPARQLQAELSRPLEAFERRRPDEPPQVYRQIGQPIPELKQEIWIETADDQPLRVPPQMPELLRLLAANAIRYTPPGGRIEARLGRENDRLKLILSDSGRGIPPADLPRVTDYGFRAGNVADLPGEGLGLTRVRQLVSRLGGKLHLATDSSLGTRVSVELPIL